MLKKNFFFAVVDKNGGCGCAVDKKTALVEEMVVEVSENYHHNHHHHNHHHQYYHYQVPKVD